MSSGTTEGDTRKEGEEIAAEKPANGDNNAGEAPTAMDNNDKMDTSSDKPVRKKKKKKLILFKFQTQNTLRKFVLLFDVFLALQFFPFQKKKKKKKGREEVE